MAPYRKNLTINILLRDKLGGRELSWHHIRRISLETYFSGIRPFRLGGKELSWHHVGRISLKTYFYIFLRDTTL